MGGYDNNDRVNATFEAILSLRFAESGTKNPSETLVDFHGWHKHTNTQTHRQTDRQTDYTPLLSHSINPDKSATDKNEGKKKIKK